MYLYQQVLQLELFIQLTYNLQIKLSQQQLLRSGIMVFVI